MAKKKATETVSEVNDREVGPQTPLRRFAMRRPTPGEQPTTPDATVDAD